MDTVFVAAVADDKRNDDDDNDDSWMRAISSDFRSGEFTEKRFHHTSSFCVRLSIILGQ